MDNKDSGFYFKMIYDFNLYDASLVKYGRSKQEFRGLLLEYLRYIKSWFISKPTQTIKFSKISKFIFLAEEEIANTPFMKHFMPGYTAPGSVECSIPYRDNDTCCLGSHTVG